MKISMRRGALIVTLAVMQLLAQSRPRSMSPSASRDEDIRLPNGKSQRDEILKSEREQNIRDSRRLSELAGELTEELEKGDRFVLSIATLKKTDEIEKLAKKIRSRLRHN